MKNCSIASYFTISIALFLVFICQGLSAQTFNLKFEEINIDSPGFEVEVYINGSLPFKIATSNLVFNYTNGIVGNPTLVSDELGTRYSVEADEKSADKIDFNLVYQDINDPSLGLQVEESPAWTKLGTIQFETLVSGSTAVLEWLEANKSETVIYDTSGNRLVSGILTNIYSNTTLPLELISFDARPQGKDVILDWLTAYEKNFEGFDIERSIDGDTFQKIGNQKGLGNSASYTEYKWIDKNVPQVKQLYYRLKMMDIDGLFEYSEIRVVNLEQPRFSSMDVSPNPMKHSTQLSFYSSNEGKVSLSISDMSGKVLQQKEFVVQEGNNNMFYDVSHLLNGQYLLTLEIDGQKMSKSIVILE